jgi:hypothetical protein
MVNCGSRYFSLFWLRGNRYENQTLATRISSSPNSEFSNLKNNDIRTEINNLSLYKHEITKYDSLGEFLRLLIPVFTQEILVWSMASASGLLKVSRNIIKFYEN